MRRNESESVFQQYLEQHGVGYSEPYKAGRGDIDFCVKREGYSVLCEVKEIRDPAGTRLEAHEHLRGDLKKLRAKFIPGTRPEYPLVLVTMNGSSNFFTGLSVARAVLGEIGLSINRATLRPTSPIQHLPKGNAAWTRSQNTSISGVLVLDRAGNRHYLFTNPFAEKPVRQDFFPEVHVIPLRRDAGPDEILALSNIMFWSPRPGVLSLFFRKGDSSSR